MQSSGPGRTFNITPIRNPKSFLTQDLDQQNIIPNTPLPYQTFSTSHSPTSRSRTSAASTPSHAIRYPYHDPTATRGSPERDAPARPLSEVYWSPKQDIAAHQLLERHEPSTTPASMYAHHHQYMYTQEPSYMESASIQTPAAPPPVYEDSSEQNSANARHLLGLLEQDRKLILVSQHASMSRIRTLYAQLEKLRSAPDSDQHAQDIFEIESELKRVEWEHNGYARMWDDVGNHIEALWARMSVPDGDLWGCDEFNMMALARGQ